MNIGLQDGISLEDGLRHGIRFEDSIAFGYGIGSALCVSCLVIICCKSVWVDLQLKCLTYCVGLYTRYKCFYNNLVLGHNTGVGKTMVYGIQVLRVWVQCEFLAPIAILYPGLWCHGLVWVFPLYLYLLYLSTTTMITIDNDQCVNIEQRQLWLCDFNAATSFPLPLPLYRAQTTSIIVWA